MADREVSEVFSLVDNASGPLKNIASSMSGVKMQAERASMGLERLLVPALGFIGVGYGIKSFAEKLFRVDEAAREAESTITAAWIASDRFAHAGPGLALAASMKRGKEAFEEIEDMATRGVAPMSTYAAVYKNIALPALEKTKLSQKDLLKFTEDLVPALGAVSGNVQMAAFQAKMFGNILATGSGRPPKELLKVIGMTGKEFDKLRKKGVEPMFAEIKKRVAENAPQFKTLFEDPSVQFMRLRATADQLFRILGSPVMQKLNERAQELLKYVREHKTEVFETAKIWGEKIAKGLDHAVEATGFIKDHIVAISVAAAGIKFGPQVLSGFEMLSKMGGGGGGLGGGLGGVAASVFQSAMANRVDIAFAKEEGRWFGRLGETVSGFAKSLKTAGDKSLWPAISGFGQGLLAAIGPAGVVGLALAGFAVAVWAASEAIDKARKESIEREGNLKGRAQGLLAAMERGKVGTDNPFVLKEMARLGMITKQGKLSGDVGARLGGMGLSPEEGKRFFQSAQYQEIRKWTQQWPEQLAELLFPSAKEVQEKTKPPVNDFRGSTFNIKQAFAEGFDPDRIAIAFTKDLVQLGERKLTSHYAAIGGMR